MLLQCHVYHRFGGAMRYCQCHVLGMPREHDRGKIVQTMHPKTPPKAIQTLPDLILLHTGGINEARRWTRPRRPPRGVASKA